MTQRSVEGTEAKGWGKRKWEGHVAPREIEVDL